MADANAIVPIVKMACMHTGLLGYAAAWLAELPQTIWYTKCGMAFVKRDFYLMYFSAGYYYDLVLVYVLQHYFDEPRPYEHCVNSYTGTLGFPSFETQVSFSFVGFIMAHYVLWDEHMKYSSWLYMAVLTFLIPLALYYNGMNTVAQLAAGALIGLVNGFARVYFYKYFLLPYVPFMLREFSLFKALSFRDCYFRDMRAKNRAQKTL